MLNSLFSKILAKNDNKIQQQMKGCKHYQRNCLVEAPCCSLFYSCKLCHDQLYKGVKANWCKIQRMQFDKVRKVKCLNCSTIQQPTQQCMNCKTLFGKFACLKCKLYQNNPNKINDIFHCDLCKMCRRGNAQENKHCDKCGYCMIVSAYKDHKCHDNSASSNCPICLQSLQFSVKYYLPMKCGHLIHTQCLDQYSKTNINCPCCGMSLVKMTKGNINHIQKLIQSTKNQLPQQLKNKKVNIICNQCLSKTMDSQFHFYGIKCGQCGSYNTKLI